MKRRISNTLAAIAALVLLSASSFSQEKTTIRPNLVFQYIKSNEKSSLVAKFTYAAENSELPLPGLEISFSAGAEKKQLGSVTTDKTGTAVFTFADSTKLPADDQGMWNFTSEFKGNDSVDAASADVSGKDITLEANLTLVDSVKTITIAAFTTDKGKNIPAAGEIVTVSVPRMFSFLLVGEVTLDENGKGSIEFPSDIPGDSLGNITIVARFFEHPTFSTVENRIIEKWGVPTSYSIPLTHRALWTKTAPKWMIFTLSILLAGVWGHYMFAVISLILIKIDSKRKKEKDEYKL
jgi:hypothetical protein